jgi:hypothetical protein
MVRIRVYPGSEIRDPGCRGQKGIGSRIPGSESTTLSSRVRLEDESKLTEDLLFLFQLRVSG